ncbi:MAG: DUF1634 domain-containing protein [Methanobacteriota archaeon]
MAVQRRLAALRRAALSEVEDTNRLVYHVLRGGIVVSVGFVVFGFLLGAVGAGPLPDVPVGLRSLDDELLRLTPAAFLSLGVLVLVFTPMVRVVASLLSFAEDRERAYVVVTALAFGNLLLGLALGLA